MIALRIAVALALSCAAWATQGSDGAMSRAELEKLAPRSEREIEADALKTIRAAIVRDAGLPFGVRGGFAERAEELAVALKRVQQQLDTIYNFAPLLDNGRLLVPAVELVKQVSAIESDGSQLRETGRVLRIVEPARLVTLPPTWRDYLSATQNLGAFEAPSDDVLPKTSAEREIWRSALAEAWVRGRKQADAVMESELATLTEAYLGRIRYRMLVDQGIIQPASLGQTEFGIVREDDAVRIDDALFTVRRAASFSTPEQWKPAVLPAIGRPSQAEQGAD